MSSDSSFIEDGRDYASLETEEIEISKIVNETLKTNKITIKFISLSSVFKILETCGKMATKLDWKDYHIISPSQLLNILSLIPNLTHLKLNFMNNEFFIREATIGFHGDEQGTSSMARYVASQDSAEEFQPKRQKLNFKLENLKFFKLSTEKSEILDLFTSILIEDSIIDCEIRYDARSEKNRNKNSNCEQTLQKFLHSQKSIEKLSLVYAGLNFIVKEIQNMNLEELKLKFCDGSLIFIESQKNLRRLEMIGYEESKSFEEISKAVKLEELIIDFRDWKPLTDDLKSLKNLKNLKFLDVIGDSFDHSLFEKFCEIEIESIEKLKIPGYFPGDLVKKLSKGFMNLKDLEVSRISCHKLNFYAKYFPSLEKLTIWYNLNFYKGFNIVEFDTGIIGDNLKHLKLKFGSGIFPSVESLFGIFKIFPNLESFEISGEEGYGTTQFLLQKEFLVEISRQKKMKNVKFSFMNASNFLEIAEHFINLSEKIENVFIGFNIFEFGQEKLEAFKEIVKNYFVITEGKSQYNFQYRYYFNMEKIQ